MVFAEDLRECVAVTPLRTGNDLGGYHAGSIGISQQRLNTLPPTSSVRSPEYAPKARQR
ncbi:unannotated protein [freshwater metagenome]|uniref:Unannotated protein n=1 Tax=freshwater metagenome TaxID=449393 RepID=A0A6J6UWD9_9ZZZZ